MKLLMISLDKGILDPYSRSAKRMIAYGADDELFILIPAVGMEQIDLSPAVHIRSTGGNKLQQLFRLWRLGSTIIKKQKIEKITAQDPFFTGLIGLILKWQFSIPLEVQVHGDFYGGDYYKKSGAGNWLRYWFGRFMLPRANWVRVVGERVKNSLLKMGIEENKIEVRPIKINEELIRSYQPKFDLHVKYPNYKKIFLVLGRLDPVKNISWLVDVFRDVIKQQSDYLLLIVGAGQERENLLKKVEQLDLKNNIKFEGWTDDSISYLETADCLLFPSLSEGYGLVVGEAIAARCPVIISNVGVAHYEVRSGQKITILPVNDHQRFIQAILNL